MRGANKRKQTRIHSLLWSDVNTDCFLCAQHAGQQHPKTDCDSSSSGVFSPYLLFWPWLSAWPHAFLHLVTATPTAQTFMQLHRQAEKAAIPTTTAFHLQPQMTTITPPPLPSPFFFFKENPWRPTLWSLQLAQYSGFCCLRTFYLTASLLCLHHSVQNFRFTCLAGCGLHCGSNDPALLPFPEHYFCCVFYKLKAF